MNVSSQAWVVVADDANIGGLLEAARPLGTSLVAVVAGRREVADAVAFLCRREAAAMTGQSLIVAGGEVM